MKPSTQNINLIHRLYRNLHLEEARHKTGLNLVANEGCLSRFCRSFLNSSLCEKYHITKKEILDLSDAFYHEMRIRSIEELHEVAYPIGLELFDARYLDYRPLSGIHAMICIILSFSRPGDRVVSVAFKDGGHFATTELIQNLGRKPLFLEMKNEKAFETEKLLDSMAKFSPSLVMIDKSTTLFPMDIPALADCLPPQTILAYDASHVLGLIVGDEFPNPLNQGASVLFGNTHKSFPGPQKGILMTNSDELGGKIKSALDEYLVSSQHSSSTIALLFTLLEMNVFGQDYARQMVQNARALSQTLEKLDFELFSEQGIPSVTGTFLLKNQSTSSSNWAKSLETAGIFTNSVQKKDISYLRIGLQYITRMGMKTGEMEMIGYLMEQSIREKNDLFELRDQVNNLTNSFSRIEYSFDHLL